MRNVIALACGACIAAAALAGDNGFVYTGGKDLLEQNPAMEFDPGSLLVRFDPGTPPEWRERARTVVGGQLIREYTIVEGLEHITISFPLDQARQVLEAMPFVQYAEPDYVVRHSVIPNDTNFGLQWGLHNTGQTVNFDPGIADADMDGPEGWNVLTGSASFVVAVIDTGTLYTHPDLAANIWSNPGETSNGVDDDGNGYIDDIRGWDFYSDDNNPNDSDGHGTHTAGTVGAVGNNGIGVAGVAWTVKIMPLRFLGPGGGVTSDAVLALQYLQGKGVKVSNNSWSGGGSSSSLSNAINATKSVGHIFVCASGNDGLNIDSSAVYPAAYSHDNILAVAATNNNDGIAGFSNYGLTRVDVGGAPGVNILSTYLSNGYAYADGTSMASPHAAGVVAMVYIKNPGWTYSQVRTQVMNTARPIAALNGKTVTSGVVNLAAALGSATSQPPVVSIFSPGSNASFPAGQSIDFDGTAVDPEQGNISASIIWTTNLQGQIGVGASFNRSDLIVGTHIVTAQVTDATGNIDTDQRTIFVTAVTGPPSTPTNPAATSPSFGNAQFTWSDGSSNENGFTIQRQQNISGSWTGTQTVGTTAANVTLFNEAPGAGLFRYRVRAFNANGTSAWTAWAQVDTSGSSIPAPPTSPAAVALGGGQANVSWGDASGNENGFTVQRQQNVSGTWTNTGVVATTAANATSIINTPGVGLFRYRIRAFNNAGTSAWTAWATVTTN